MKSSTRNRQSRYSAGVWITGVAGFTDPADPNATPPAANRILTVPRFAGLGMDEAAAALPFGNTSRTALSAWFFVIDGGTSAVSVICWWLDEVRGLWVKNGAGQAFNLRLSTTNGIAIYVVGSTHGRKLYSQIVTNEGVSTMAFLVR